MENVCERSSFLDAERKSHPEKEVERAVHKRSISKDSVRWSSHLKAKMQNELGNRGLKEEEQRL